MLYELYVSSSSSSQCRNMGPGDVDNVLNKVVNMDFFKCIELKQSVALMHTFNVDEMHKLKCLCIKCMSLTFTTS